MRYNSAIPNVVYGTRQVHFLSEKDKNTIAIKTLYCMSNYYPFDFLIYSVGKHPKYFLKLVAKYDGVLNPTIVLTSATVYRPSFSSLAASLKQNLTDKVNG